MKQPRESISASGVSLLYEPDESHAAIVDIVFVHGLGGHPLRTWLYRDPLEHFTAKSAGGVGGSGGSALRALLRKNSRVGGRTRSNSLSSKIALDGTQSELDLGIGGGTFTRERRVLRKNSDLRRPRRNSRGAQLDFDYYSSGKENSFPLPPDPRGYHSSQSTSRLKLLLQTNVPPLFTADGIDGGGLGAGGAGGGVGGFGGVEGVYWPLDLLPDACRTSRILTWGCQTLSTNGKLLPAQNDVFANAEELLRDLTAYRDQTNTLGRAVIFVAHSTGGVIVKEALRRSEFGGGGLASGLASGGDAQSPHSKDLLQSTAAVVFLGCPHRASQYASLGDAVKSMAGATLGIDPADPVLQDLSGAARTELIHGREAFVRLWNDYNFRVKTYQETLGLPQLAMMETKPDFTIRRQSSFFGDVRESAESTGSSHLDMCRFKSAQDPTYKSLAATLSRLVHDEISRLRQLSHKEQACARLIAPPRVLPRERSSIVSYPGTCLWLYDLPEFRGWHHRTPGSRHKILWVRGRPGSGKSVLLRSLRARLEKQWAPLGASFISSPAHGDRLDSVFFDSGGGPRRHHFQHLRPTSTSSPSPTSHLENEHETRAPIGVDSTSSSSHGLGPASTSLHNPGNTARLWSNNNNNSRSSSPAAAVYRNLLAQLFQQDPRLRKALLALCKQQRNSHSHTRIGSNGSGRGSLFSGRGGYNTNMNTTTANTTHTSYSVSTGNRRQQLATTTAVSCSTQTAQHHSLLDDAQIVQFFADDYAAFPIQTPTRRTFIFIDAADDCGPTYVQELLLHLSLLARNSDFSICVATADYPPRADLALNHNTKGSNDNSKTTKTTRDNSSFLGVGGGHPYTSATATTTVDPSAPIPIDIITPALPPSAAFEVVMHLRNADDITRYVSLSLEAEWEDRNATVVRIAQKSGGVFMWAEIVVGILNAAIGEGADQQLIDDTVLEMPGDLDGLYEWLLSTLTPEEKAETMALFQWVILASEPMRLNDLRTAVRITKSWTAAEMRPSRALALDPPRSLRELLQQHRQKEVAPTRGAPPAGVEGGDISAVPVATGPASASTPTPAPLESSTINNGANGSFESPVQFHRWIRSRSIGLLELRPSTGDGTPPSHEPLGLQRVQVIHESVRSFFLSGRGFAALERDNETTLYSHSFSTEDLADLSHYVLLNACLTYLDATDFECLGGSSGGGHNASTAERRLPPLAPMSYEESKYWRRNARDQRRLVVSSYPFLGYAVDNLLFHMLSPRFFRYYLPQRDVLRLFAANRCRLWRRWTALLGASACDPDGVLTMCSRGPARDLLDPVYGARFRLERVFRRVARMAATEMGAINTAPAATLAAPAPKEKKGRVVFVEPLAIPPPRQEREKEPMARVARRSSYSVMPKMQPAPAGRSPSSASTADLTARTAGVDAATTATTTTTTAPGPAAPTTHHHHHHHHVASMMASTSAPPQQEAVVSPLASPVGSSRVVSFNSTVVPSIFSPTSPVSANTLLSPLSAFEASPMSAFEKHAFAAPQMTPQGYAVI